jgi:hypothetical protein
MVITGTGRRPAGRPGQSTIGRPDPNAPIPENHGYLLSCNEPPLQPELCVLMRSSGKHVAGSRRLLEKEHKWTRMILEHQT